MQKVELPLFGSTLTFSLENFEGPLELLIYLIQREEISLFEIALKELTAQFFNELEAIPTVDIGADFLWNSSKLLLLKSRLLLPQEEGKIEEQDFRAEILQKLIEYAKLKEVALDLFARGEREGLHFSRAVEPVPRKHGTGLDEVSIEQLQTLLQELMKKSVSSPQKVLKGEEWEISPKIEWLQEWLPKRIKIHFQEIFSQEKPKGEWIVFFLAILELMKLQKIKLVSDDGHLWIHHAESI